VAQNLPILNSVPQNLSMTERAISVALGLGLAAAGAKPRPNPVLNVLALAGGSYLALRGATGRCPIKQGLVKAHLIADRRAPQLRSRRPARKAA
jgi:uncharacterized membrane protein